MNLVEIFAASHRECIGKDASLLFTRFYCNLATELDFSGTGDDPLLEKTLQLLVDFSRFAVASDDLRHCAARLAEVGVPPRLYERWIEALLKSLAQVDPNFRPEDALAWRVILAPGLEFMRYCSE